MKVSRFALLVTSAAAALLLSVGLLSSRPADAQSSIKLADTPFSFKSIFEGDDVRLESDRSTYTAMLDSDDDLVVGGVFRLTRKNAGAGEKAVFVTVTMAVCGYQGILVVKSKDFSLDGSPMGETVDGKPIQAVGDTAAGAAYTALCSSNIKPSAKDPGYIAPERYKRFWS